jgi:hypothetical protein
MRQLAMVKFWKRALGVSLLAGAGYAAWRAFGQRAAETTGLPSGAGWESQPFPYPPQPRMAPVPAADAWIEPADGTCPASHPVKAKMASGIFHEPGGASYERTKADRCYTSAAAALADGLRSAKR